MCNQQLGDGDAAWRAGSVQDRGALAVDGVDSGPVGQQGLGHAEAVVVTGPRQGRAVDGCVVDVGAAREQELSNCRMAFATRNVEGGEAAVEGGGMDVGAV